VTSVVNTKTVLDRIVAQTRIDLDRRKRRTSREELLARFDDRPDPIDVRAALNQDTVSVIAEIKRASPSKGRFPLEVDPAEVAQAYAAGGSGVISCLTDEPFFHGSLRDLKAVTSFTEHLPVPIAVLRKDFTIDRYQIDEARASGASCILLIVACLTDDLMRELNDYAMSLGMSVLVEVHNREELDRALGTGSRLVGVNNRNLKTLAVDLNVTVALAPLVPRDVVLVAESGIDGRDHVELMANAGVDAILVGESLIVQEDRTAAVRKLTGVRRSRRE
jgi:indole-3-glycerol phosphate synthase